MGSDKAPTAHALTDRPQETKKHQALQLKVIGKMNSGKMFGYLLTISLVLALSLKLSLLFVFTF